MTAFALEQRAANVEMLDEVCRDLRLEWPGNSCDHRGRSRLGMADDQFPETPVLALGD